MANYSMFPEHISRLPVMSTIKIGPGECKIAPTHLEAGPTLKKIWIFNLILDLPSLEQVLVNLNALTKIR